MKEILEALGTRIRSPLFGYAVLAFFAVNWEALLFLWLEEGGITKRIELFNSNTDYLSLLLFPAVLAIAGALVYPWIHLLFLRIANKPTHLRNSLQAEAEHALLLQKQELEVLRNSMLTQKEEGLIEQAKRDQEILQIENEELREKLKTEIEKIRSEQERLVNVSPKSTLSNDNEKHVKDLVNLYQKRAEEAKKEFNHEKAEEYWRKAEDLQMQLAEKALKPNPTL